MSKKKHIKSFTEVSWGCTFSSLHVNMLRVHDKSERYCCPIEQNLSLDSPSRKQVNKKFYPVFPQFSLLELVLS